MEPDEAKDDAHGLGDALVVRKRHGLVKRHLDHLDELPLLRLTATLAHAIVVRHLGVEHRLLGPRHADA